LSLCEMSLLANAEITEPDTANAFGGAMDFTSPAQSTGKQSLWQFVSTNHTLLALWFAGPDEALSVLLPCCCCTANITKGLSPRNRVFIFSFVLVAVFFVTVCVSLEHQEPTWLWIFIWSVLFVLPATCRIKSELPPLSDRLMGLNSALSLPLRAEELGLLCLLLAVVIFAGVKGSYAEAAKLFADFFGSLLFAMCAEFLTLIWKYFFCAICCRCCLPPGQSPGYPGENGATIFV